MSLNDLEAKLEALTQDGKFGTEDADIGELVDLMNSEGTTRDGLTDNGRVELGTGHSTVDDDVDDEPLVEAKAKTEESADPPTTEETPAPLAATPPTPPPASAAEPARTSELILLLDVA